MISVTIHRQRSNYYDNHVRLILSQLPSYTKTVEGAARIFNTDIEAIPKKSTGSASLFYKVFFADDEKSFEVWHLNALGDKDKITATITQL